MAELNCVCLGADLVSGLFPAQLLTDHDPLAHDDGWRIGALHRGDQRIRDSTAAPTAAPTDRAARLIAGRGAASGTLACGRQCFAKVGTAATAAASKTSLISRNGADFTKRFPRIVEAARRCSTSRHP